MGIVMIWCPAVGRAFSTGIETDAQSFSSLPNNPARANCPYCGSVHVWWKEEAWLANNGEGDLPVVAVKQPKTKAANR
jgi:hypothetical protein